MGGTTTRNVTLLALCQALAVSGNMLVITTSALAAIELAPSPSFATLPLTLQFILVMLTTLPVSLLMKRIGRRPGFQMGALFGACAGALGCFAILEGSFVLFCLAGALYGVFMASVQFYRFAAADATEPAHRARAISYVLAGGVLAALAGPELAKLTTPLFAPILFAGSYLALVGLTLLSTLLLAFIRIAPPSASEQTAAGRPLLEIIRQPRFVVALTVAVISYGTMNLVMTATPLAMSICGFALGDTAFVIQWHALGMFAPSFVTGRIIERVGVLKVTGLGLALIGGCVVINLAGVTLGHFWWALLLLGLGWNFAFVGATTLLTTTYRPEERAKVQGVNDLTIFAGVACTAFASGALHHLFGWQAVNLGVLVPVLTTALLVLWLAHRERSRLAPAAT